MSTRLTSVPLRVFIIGPMGDQVPDQSGMNLAEHLPNIKRATENAVAALSDRVNGRSLRCDVSAPQNRAGDIVDNIFDQIIHCDLAIADISNRSPNVFYELAMLHANGVPVILLTQRENNGENRNAFYLLQQNVVGLKNFEVETIYEALIESEVGELGILEDLILMPSRSQRNNPITKYFKGVPFVNVAAATGVATGYYYNFIQWVLRTGCIFRDYPECTHLIIVRPDRLGSLDTDIGRLEKVFGTQLEDGGDSRLMKIERLDYKHQGHPRDGYNIRKLRTVFIDYPTPISSLTASLQYERIIDFLSDKDTLSESSRVASDDELKSFEQRIIDAFFVTLSELAFHAKESLDHRRLKSMTVDEIIDKFGASGL